MRYKGLFIGIDRYAAKGVTWLSCARRDAQALHALFMDTFQGEATLLTDEGAGLQQVKEAIRGLSTASEDDLVVVTFSGHGSDSHELLTHDSILDRLHETGLPLDELNTLIQTIPAKRILVILDCCFSGGMGVKGVSSPVKSRDTVTVDTRLDEISGTGRVVITASRSDESAYELQKYQHGLLTYFLMEGLQGAEEVRQSGKINTYDLLNYVTKRVEDESSKIGRLQHPTLRGSIDGTFLWPVFQKGNSYFKLFPEACQSPVASELESLQVYGFPTALLQHWKHHIPQLNSLQLAAINDYSILRGEDLIVSAPTSSGKTMIGEVASIKAVLDRKRSLFLFPLKAIVSEKYRHFKAMYEAYGIRTIRATGDSNDEVPDLIMGRYDICLLTYEKFAALLLANPFIVDNVGVIVIDEVQMITDESRGSNLEFILTILNLRRQKIGTPQLICLSAVIGDTNGLERWLSARLLHQAERPVPLDEGIVTGTGSFRYVESDTGQEKRSDQYVSRVFRKGGSQEWIIPLVKRLISEQKQVIVFREKKGETRGCAEYLAESLGLSPADRALESLPSGDPSLLSSALRRTLQGGVAIHNADLDPDERRIVEEHFREKESQIRVIVATTTLAMGVNTPAEAVIIAGLNHPALEPKPYSVAEYKNIAGRAGRLGFSQRGSSYLLALDQHLEHEYWRRYVCGRPEDIKSRFLDPAADIRTTIIRVLASARSSSGKKLVGLTSKETVEFITFSFGAFQMKQQSSSWRLEESSVLGGLGDLASSGLVTTTVDGTYRLTELGWLAGHSGIEVESVIRLAKVLRLVSPAQITDQCLIAAIQCTVELDNVIMLLNSKGIRKEISTWAGELGNQQISSSVIHYVQQSASSEYMAASRLKKAAACLLWISDFSMSQIEDILTKHGRKFDGASGNVRSATNRTRDLLSLTIRIAELIHPTIDFDERPAKLAIRLEAGVSPAMLNIASYTGNQLSRADYHEIAKKGTLTFEELTALSDDELSAIVSNDPFKVQLIRVSAKRAKENADSSDVHPPLLPAYEN